MILDNFNNEKSPEEMAKTIIWEIIEDGIKEWEMEQESESDDISEIHADLHVCKDIIFTTLGMDRIV